jgi:hypothetical protein
MQKHVICCFLLSGMTLFTITVTAQDAPKWTPEEQKELFGYCEKPVLVKKLNISEETADKIGEIDLWAVQQKLSVDANTNERYATHGEVEEEVIKKLKALRLSGDQLKALTERRADPNPKPCVVTTLSFNQRFDTVPQARAVQLYKTQYRKILIDKLGINGRQADQVFETEAWKQKEAATIAAIPANDFNRVRKTVAMHTQRDHRYKVIGLTEEQAAAAVQFFAENPVFKP